MTSKPTLPKLARQLQRAVPKSVGNFDAAAFMHGQVGSSTLHTAPGTASASDRPTPFQRSAEGPQASPQSETPADTTPDTPVMSPRYPLDTSPAESDEVSTGINSIGKQRCSGTAKSTGKTCRAYALRGRTLCLFHEDDAISGLSYMQENARETRRRRAQSAVGLTELGIDLANPFGLQMALELFLRMDLAGTISAARSVRMVRYIRALQANIPRVGANSNSYREEFLEARRSALRSALPLADRSAILDHDERVTAIADRRALRQALLETNDKFARTHPKPDRNPPAPRTPDFPAIDPIRLAQAAAAIYGHPNPQPGFPPRPQPQPQPRP